MVLPVCMFNAVMDTASFKVHVPPAELPSKTAVSPAPGFAAPPAPPLIVDQ